MKTEILLCFIVSHKFQGFSGSHLFCFLLASSDTDAYYVCVQTDIYCKCLVMIRSALIRNDIFNLLFRILLNDLLKNCLVVIECRALL